MNVKASKIIECAKSHLGENYVYGCKHEVLTKDKYNELKRAYGDMVWNSDIKKIGTLCCDCSGLCYISLKEAGAGNYNIGSGQFYDKASVKEKITDYSKIPVGAFLWLRGHIGIYLGNGKYIAEDGSAYGCRIANVNQNKWTHYLLFDFIDYTETAQEDKELFEAVQKIIKAGVKIDFNSWKRVDLINLKNVNSLLLKLGGLDKLVKIGIISSPDIWIERTYTKENVRSLLIKYGSRC